jgi:hypothetical protein
VVVAVIFAQNGDEIQDAYGSIKGPSLCHIEPAGQLYWTLDYGSATVV